METLEELKEFILDPQRMRMSHLYKPLMMIAVLKREGEATRDEIAAEFIARDVFQLEHYRRNVVDKMPGVRLVRDGVLERSGDVYRIASAFRDLSLSQRYELIAACERRIEEFIATRGDPFSGRNTEAMPVGVRYEVLKRSGGRCELCGVSHEEVPLEVDHIVPRANGGSNDLSNLQVLCRSCNADKRHLDDTNFTAVRDSFSFRVSDCVFCQAEKSDRLLAEDELAFAIADAFPVTEGHRLAIPRRHVQDYFELWQSERNSIERLLLSERKALMGADPSIVGFNIGANAGSAAGQTVAHAHIHLIPRREGDADNPRGGVRGVIPARQDY